MIYLFKADDKYVGRAFILQINLWYLEKSRMRHSISIYYIACSKLATFVLLIGDIVTGGYV